MNLFPYNNGHLMVVPHAHQSTLEGLPSEALTEVMTLVNKSTQILREAMNAGYLSLERVAAAVVPASQPSLLRGRGRAWGRMLACRLLGVPTPRYRGLPMFRWWWSRLTAREKARSIRG